MSSRLTKFFAIPLEIVEILSTINIELKLMATLFDARPPSKRMGGAIDLRNFDIDWNREAGFKLDLYIHHRNDATAGEFRPVPAQLGWVGVSLGKYTPDTHPAVLEMSDIWSRSDYLDI